MQRATGSGREDWMSDAGCTKLPLAVFFPTDEASAAVARRVCNACPVRDMCLEYALVYRLEHGVWGGASAEERHRMLAQRQYTGV